MSGDDLLEVDKRLEELKEQAAKIGHNLGPSLVEAEEELLRKASEVLEPRSELKKFEVILDMMGSHVRGERLLPEMSAAYVAVGLMIVAGFTGIGLSIAPLAVAAGDVAVLVAIYATLRGEISTYVDWRRNDDPNYAAEIE